MTAVLSPRRPRRWIGFFVVLAILAAVAVLVPLVYNLSIQLHPGQLAQARERWQKQAPLNYDLEYLVRTTHPDQEEEDAYLVQVRSGQTVLVVHDNEVVYLDPSLAFAAGVGVLALSSESPQQYGVPALFDAMEMMLRQEGPAGRRNFATAQFDPQDGHPFHYVYRVRGTKERTEWNIKMTPLPPAHSLR
jgi:hypothetical protein